MLKTWIGKLYIRVWCYPTLFLYLIFIYVGFIFWLTNPYPEQHFIEPESGREKIFESLIGILFILYLWFLLFRFKRYNIPLSWLARTGVVFLTIAFLLGICCNIFLGCYKPENKMESVTDKIWMPSPEQVQQAHAEAVKFARNELKVSEDILNRIKYHTDGFYRNGKQIVHLEFIDPSHFSDWENVHGILGGFPHYFTISVDAEKFKIVDHYACEE